MVEMSSLHVRGAAIARRSTKVEPWQVTYVRDIEAGDLALLAGPRPPTDPKAPLAKLREPHHALAQLIAAGESDIAAARLTGYSVARVRTLQADPAFSELVIHYSEEKVHAEGDLFKSIAHVAATAGSILQERLEEEPDSFSNEDLRKLRNDSLDRVGLGPTSKKEVTVSDPRGVLNEIRSLMVSESTARIIDRSAPIDAEYKEVLDDDPESPPAEESTVSASQSDGSVLDRSEAQGESP